MQKTLSDYAVYCFDIDGTIAPTYEKISPTMATMLCELLQGGKTIVLVTGRGMHKGSLAFDNVQKGVIDQLPCFEQCAAKVYAAPAGGAVLYTYNTRQQQWQAVFQKRIPTNTLDRIAPSYEAALAEVLQEDDVAHAYPSRFVYREDFSVACTSIDPAKAPQELRRGWDSDYTKRNAMIAHMKKGLEGVSMRVGGGTTIDITAEGVDKKHVLEQFFAQSGFAASDSVFVGDGFGKGGNDEVVKELDMHIIAVAGPEEVLKVFGSKI